MDIYFKCEGCGDRTLKDGPYNTEAHKTKCDDCIYRNEKILDWQRLEREFSTPKDTSEEMPRFLRIGLWTAAIVMPILVGYSYDGRAGVTLLVVEFLVFMAYEFGKQDK